MSDKVATGTAYASSFVTIFAASFSLNELLAIGGFLIGVATFLYNCYSKERMFRADQEYRLAMLEEFRHKSVLAIDDNSVKIGEQ